MKSHSGMQTKSDTNNTHRGTVRAVLDQGNAEADALKQTAQTQTGGQQTDQHIDKTLTNKSANEAKTKRRSPTNRAEDQ